MRPRPPRISTQIRLPMLLHLDNEAKQNARLTCKMKSCDIAALTLGVAASCVMCVILVSLVRQTSAVQSYSLTQTLFPALNAAGYEYWLDWGTLLGAAREGTMIAHDNDADIGMRESEFQRLKKEWGSNPAFKGMRLSKETKNLYRVRKGLGWVDVFRYDDSSPDMLTMISMSEDEHSCKCEGGGHSVAQSMIFPLTSIVFGSVTAPAPSNATSYLEHLYGQNWTTPLAPTSTKSKLSKLVPLNKPY